MWLIEVYISQRASQNLIRYLNERLEKDLKVKRYFYPVINLTIETPFNIGDIQVTYLTKKYFDEYWDYVKDGGNIKKEEFDSLLRKYQGRVFIVIEAFAESKKGEDISYEKACLAMDMIKLLSPTIYFPDNICLIDLETRIPYKSEYLTQHKESKFDFRIIMSANNNPFHLSNNMYGGFKDTFNILGELFRGNKNELEELLINSIKLIAKAIRETDLHLRISLLIMVIESIFLLDEEDFKMENKCKRRISELMFSTDGKKYQTFTDVLSNMYLIRHKMTHKSMREYIELKNLREFQINLMESIFRILHNKNKLKNKDTLIEILDKKIKTNV